MAQHSQKLFLSHNYSPSPKTDPIPGQSPATGLYKHYAFHDNSLAPGSGGHRSGMCGPSAPQVQ